MGCFDGNADLNNTYDKHIRPQQIYSIVSGFPAPVVTLLDL